MRQGLPATPLSDHLPARTDSSFLLPAAVARLGSAGEKAFLEFFTAQIRNENTRAAYFRAVRRFPLAGVWPSSLT